MPPIRLAYCSVCRGVLPFAETPYRKWLASRSGFTCERCGTLHRSADPGRAKRSAALRWFVYSAFSGMAAAVLGAGMASVGMQHPLATPRVLAVVWAFVALSVVCLAGSIRMGLHATDFASLTSWERSDLDRRLCPGMIRSDVVDELARRGWPIGKIRTALGALRPAARDAA